MVGMHHQAMLATALRIHMLPSSQWCHTQTNTTLSHRRKTLALAEDILAMITGVTGVVVKWVVKWVDKWADKWADKWVAKWVVK